ncbi:MAG: metal-dependent transcriptional regulator [Dehalococcoidia bacterium]|jgi:DtxR family Mn-dependent transcriptional regulator
MEGKPTASMEDYLESIIMLRKGNQAVRVSQMSQALGVKMPSVTLALKKLSEEGLVEHQRYGRVQLTPEGEKVAKDVFRRHEALRRFLGEILNVDAEVAENDACKMEHAVSPLTQKRLAKFVDFILSRPEVHPYWLDMFERYAEHGEFPEGCPVQCSGK